MKRLIFVFTILSMGLIWGCGGDDGGPGPDPTPSTRIQVTTNTAGLDLNDPLDSDWGTIDSVTVDVSQDIPPAKLNPSLAATVTNEVKIKAAIRSDSLFMWFQWVDTTNDVWPNNWKISKNDFPMDFDSSLFDFEDQMYALFYDNAGSSWDVWNWRVITTGAVNFAEGMNWINQVLTSNEGGTINPLPVALRNKKSGFRFPLYVSSDTSEFTESILFFEDALSENDTIFWPDDTTFWYKTTGWQIDQKIPGWVIFGSVLDKTEAQRGSRWDIGAYSAYTNNTYSLVMVRKLNTGYTDDFDLSTLDSVKVQLGILNNQASFTTGSNNRGFSEEFWLIF